jgi:hypothetical protein
MKQPEVATEDSPPENQEQEENGGTTHLRGLWAVMGSSEGTVEEPTVEEETARVESEEGTEEEEETEAGRSRGLWEVMRQSETDSDSPAEGSESDEDGPIPGASISLPDNEPVSLEELAEIEKAENLGDLSAEATSAVEQEVTHRSRRCLVSLGLGSLSLPLSAIATLPPEPWTRLPALLFGLAAVHTGLVALSEIRSGQGTRTDRLTAITGAVLGTVGMFLFSLVSWLL